MCEKVCVRGWKKGRVCGTSVHINAYLWVGVRTSLVDSQGIVQGASLFVERLEAEPPSHSAETRLYRKMIRVRDPYKKCATPAWRHLRKMAKA